MDKNNFILFFSCITLGAYAY